MLKSETATANESSEVMKTKPKRTELFKEDRRLTELFAMTATSSWKK